MISDTTIIESLWLYPVKSLRGVMVSSAKVESGGFAEDRRWMLVDPKTGTFMSQRTLHKMALVHPEMDETSMTLSAQGFGQKTFSKQATGLMMEVGVWRDRFNAQRMDESISQWCSHVLGVDCVMVQKCAQTRKVASKYLDDQASMIHEVSFADAFPFLLLGSKTLEQLNEKLQIPVSVRRFRPNIVVHTQQPGEEDMWESLTHAQIQFRVVKPCDRCVLINVDPDLGDLDVHKEPLKTLATYRRAEDGLVYFGQNLLHRGDGVLRVGDVLSVLKRAQ